MTATDPAPSTPPVSMPEVFLGHLAAGEFVQLASLFEPDATLRALLPDGFHEWHGPEGVAAAFVTWFGRVQEYALLDAAVGHLGPRLQLRWRARVRGGPFGDSSFVVEQHVYADAGPSGRIGAMSMLCSGFAKERS